MVELLPLAAEEAAEPSRTPFYVAGTLLVVWAVVVAVVGLRSPAFPRGGAGARGVMTISTVLVVVTLATVILTA